MTDRVLLPTATAVQARRATWNLLRPRRRLATLTVVALLIGTVAGLAVPALLGRVVDVVIEHGNTGTIDLLAAALLLAITTSAIFDGLATILMARLGEAALADLREQVVDRVLDLPLTAVEQAGTGDVVARVGDDVESASTAIRGAIPKLVTATLDVVLTVVGLTILDWRLAIAGLAAIPIHLLSTRWYLRRSKPVYAAERIAIGQRAQQLTETVTGASTVRTFRLEEGHRTLVETASQAALDRTLLAGRIGARFYALLNGAELVGLGTTLLVGFLAVRSGTISVGEATAGALYFHRLFDPIGSLLGLIDTAQDASAALVRLVGVSQIAPAIEPPETAAVTDASVRLKGVHFAYESGHEILHGIDLDIEPGMRAALIGSSGAGKTTIAKLVAGIHRPDTGSVSLGGATHDELGPRVTRRMITLVTQEVHVFAGPLAEDLRLARPDASDDELHAALDLVGAREWVDLLPDGLNTVVGEHGLRVTPMQAQQIALARVALVDTPIVVLDEATAEAGSAGARVLEGAANRVIAGRTALIVAHRLTQAANADHVTVLSDGRVLEQGHPDELIAAGGAFAGMWSAWSALHQSERR